MGTLNFNNNKYEEILNAPYELISYPYENTIIPLYFRYASSYAPQLYTFLSQALKQWKYIYYEDAPLDVVWSKRVWTLSPSSLLKKHNL